MGTDDAVRRITRRRAVILASTNPYWNLAAEEVLFNTLPEGSGALLLYVNEPVVVIGRHQNPWLEVDLPELLRRGVSLVRRISGGGAVYHDEGNLNFSFLGPHEGFDRRKNLEFVRGVLLSIGIQTDISDSVDLYAGQGKVSGNAFCFRKNRSLHHGTLLIDTDLGRLQGLLSPPPVSIETHAVKSRPATTANLASLSPGMTRGTLVTALAKAYLEQVGETEIISAEDFDHPEVDELVKRNRSWEWSFGRTPDFRLKAAGATVEIKKGLIGSIEGGLPRNAAPGALAGVPFRKPDLARLLGDPPAGLEALITALHSLAV